MKTLARTIAAVVVAFIVVGCSSTEVVKGPVAVSVGQQLLDLKRAQDSGAMTAQQYDEQRRALINSVK